VKTYKIFSKKSCPYCAAAIQLCEEKGVSYQRVSLDASPHLLTEVKRKYSWDTVPLILELGGDNEKFIGGYTDLVEYFNTGKTLLKG
tara:strand:- start:3525 stop:3785 length:261 start_codon:yes stop_codon:yes gene_type:complete